MSQLLRSVAVCCSLLQSVAVCCSLLQSVAVCCRASYVTHHVSYVSHKSYVYLMTHHICNLCCIRHVYLSHVRVYVCVCVSLTCPCVYVCMCVCVCVWLCRTKQHTVSRGVFFFLCTHDVFTFFFICMYAKHQYLRTRKS